MKKVFWLVLLSCYSTQSLSEETMGGIKYGASGGKYADGVTPICTAFD